MASLFLSPAINLSPVSTTPAISENPWQGLISSVVDCTAKHLLANVSANLRKIRYDPNGILKCTGDTDSWKNRNSKISRHTPFKNPILQTFLSPILSVGQVYCLPSTSAETVYCRPSCQSDWFIVSHFHQLNWFIVAHLSELKWFCLHNSSPELVYCLPSSSANLSLSCCHYQLLWSWQLSSFRPIFIIDTYLLVSFLLCFPSFYYFKLNYHYYWPLPSFLLHNYDKSLTLPWSGTNTSQ